MAVPAGPDDGGVYLSVNHQKNIIIIISGPVDGPKHTPNESEELQACGDEQANHNKFRSIAFSRSVQARFVRPVFVAAVSKHIPMISLPRVQELKT